MKRVLLVIVTFFTIVCCNKKDSKMNNDPLISVLKLQSAESLLNFGKAKEFIDIDRVYKSGSEDKWKESVEFFYNLGQNKKFTNSFKYHNFDINQQIISNKAVVSFIAYNSKAKINEIVYQLELVDNKWKVVDIEYRSGSN